MSGNSGRIIAKKIEQLYATIIISTEVKEFEVTK